MENIHYGQIEHIVFTRNEQYVVLMSSDFRVSFWSTSTWELTKSFKAYHDSHVQYYLRALNEAAVMAEFDISVLLSTNACGTLFCGLYNGGLQFWDVNKKELSFEVHAHLAEVTGLVLNNDESILVTAGADYLINVWNVVAKALLFEIRE